MFVTFVVHVHIWCEQIDGWRPNISVNTTVIPKLNTVQRLGLAQCRVSADIIIQTNKCTQFFKNYNNNIIKLRLLHVSALTGPSSGSTQLYKAAVL